MAGFGQYPFGHAPFGGGVSDLTPGALTVVLSTAAGAVASGGSPLPLVLTLSLPASTAGITVLAEPLTGFLTCVGPEVTSYSTTLAPSGLAGMLSVPLPAIFSYTDTVTLVPGSVGLALGTAAPVVTVVSTLLTPGVMPLALSLLPPAQPVDATHLHVAPVTATVSLVARTLPITAGWVTVAPVTVRLSSPGLAGHGVLLTPAPVTLTLRVQASDGGGYFVYAGLPYSVDPIRVTSPWALEPALQGFWELVVRVGEVWALRERSTSA